MRFLQYQQNPIWQRTITTVSRPILNGKSGRKALRESFIANFVPIEVLRVFQHRHLLEIVEVH